MALKKVHPKMIIFTFQAMTEEDLEGWVSVMEGQINVSRPQISSKTEMQSRSIVTEHSRYEYQSISSR
jgi:hypothetical protein